MGGVERVAIQLANSFQQFGINTSLIDFSAKNQFYYDIDNQIKVPHVINPRKIKRKIVYKLHEAKYKINNKPLEVYFLYKEQTNDLINYLKESQCDILILCQGILTALIPNIKKALPNIKIVAWQHNDFDIYTKNYYQNILDDYFRGLKSADLVVCLTEEDMQKFKSYNSNSCYIYNPLTLNNPKISNLDNKNIIFVGRLVIKQKGLDYLIEIAKSLEPGWRILVAGAGSDKEIFENMIQDNNLVDRVVLKGSLSESELADFYSSGSIFISTSRWEGFGLVLTEAMATGLPVVSFSNHGPTEILKDGMYGVLVENYDISKFSNELKELMLFKEKREKLQQYSIERAADFSSRIILKEWINKLRLLED